MPSPSRMLRQQRTPGRPVEVPYGVRVAAAWTWRLAVIGAGLWALLYVIALFQVIVIPLLIAALVAALLLPFVDGLHRAGLHRGLAAGLVLLAALAAVVGLLALVWARIVTGFDDLQAQAVQGWYQVQEWLRTGPLNVSGAQLDDYLATVQDQLAANQQELVQGAFRFTSTAGHVVTGLVLALFASFFFLLDGDRIWHWLVRLLPGDAREPMDGAARRGWATLTSYVRAQLVVAVVDAVGIGIGAVVLGVPLALPLAVLVFLSAFVPIAGALVSGAVAVLVALVANGPVNALLMLAVVVAVQQAESNILAPLLLGRAVHVHPLAVIVAITAGVLLAGVIGALVAVPLVAVANTVVLHLTGADEHAEVPEGVPERPLASDPVGGDGLTPRAVRGDVPG